MTRRAQTDPSRHTKRKRSTSTNQKQRRVGPTASELAGKPREHGHRTAAPKRPRAGQPSGHVGAR
jgi:hypothetical protein